MNEGSLAKIAKLRNAAEAELDRMAKARAAGTGEDFYTAYAQVTGTPDGAVLLGQYDAASRLQADMIAGV